MSWNGKSGTRGGVIERGFDLDVKGHRVPGVYWTPAEAGNDRLVLLGHGGTTHKKVEYIENVARLLAARGIAAMAIDGPGHGERAQAAFDANDTSAFARAWTSGGGTETVIADWRTALDFIETEAGARPTGWWGLSMGTMMGLPVCAADARIRVALLGLMGTWGPNGDDLLRLAPQVQCPVRFLVQWDDEIVPRDTCLKLFSEIGSKKKTLHANPGRHVEVPAFEVEASVEYLERNLR
jgi:alpha-beta hydrolase superfamily lysophospholipase